MTKQRRPQKGSKQNLDRVNKTAQSSPKNPATPNEDDIFADFFNEQPRPQTGKTAKEDQQRQWISDQVMWETTLGMREDEAVKNVLSTNDQPKNAPRKATPNTQNQPKRNQIQRGQPQKLVQDSTAPVAPIKSRPTQNTANHNQTSNRVKSTSAQSNPSTRAHRQRVTSKQKQRPQQIQRGTNSAPNYEAKTTIVEPAVFEARDTNPYVDTQDLTEIKQKLKSEKFKKFVSNHWSKIVIAMASFVVGYFAGINNPSLPGEATSRVSSIDREKYKAIIAKSEKRLKANKSNSKKSEPVESKKPRAKTVTPVQAPVSDSEAIVYNPEPVQQYDGKDIPLQNNSLDSEPEIINNDPLDTDAQELNPDTHSIEASGESVPNFMDVDSPSLEVSPDSTTMDTVPTNEEIGETKESRLEQLLDESLIKFEDQEWQAVIDLSSQILAIDANITSALINRSVAYTELTEFELALEDCNLALKINPENSLAINNRGYTYEKMGNIEMAVKDYEKACELGIELSCTEAERLKQAATTTLD